MRLLTLTLLLFASFAQASSMILPIVEVYDGDTIKTRMSLPPPLNKVSIRLLGVDTPEMPAKSYLETGKLGRAKCIKEAELAIEAKQLVVELAKEYKVMTVTDFTYGKFGGRVLGVITIGDVNIAQLLIDKKMAVPYYGKKKTMDWCQ